MLITYMYFGIGQRLFLYFGGEGGILLGLLHVKSHVKHIRQNPLYFWTMDRNCSENQLFEIRIYMINEKVTVSNGNFM